MSATARRTPLTLLREPEFLAIAAIKFASGMSFATVLLALALYTDQFAVSGGVAGLFGTAYAVVRLLLVLPVGRYIDLGDAKRYLVAGVLVVSHYGRSRGRLGLSSGLSLWHRLRSVFALPSVLARQRYHATRCGSFLWPLPRGASIGWFHTDGNRIVKITLSSYSQGDAGTDISPVAILVLRFFRSVRTVRGILEPSCVP